MISDRRGSFKYFKRKNKRTIQQVARWVEEEAKEVSHRWNRLEQCVPKFEGLGISEGIKLCFSWMIREGRCSDL